MEAVTSKTCSRCGAEKPVAEFYARARSRDGLQAWCKDCNRESTRTWTRDNAETLNERDRERRREHGGGYENKHYRYLYGITIEQYHEMLDRQEGVCAICREPETTTLKGTLRALVVDHDHSTGVVRGLLRNRCNSALGWLNDDPALLAAALDYLTKEG